KSEAACRQIVHRAKAQLRDERPRIKVEPADHRRLLEGFAKAAASGDVHALRSLLAEDVELISDSGGKVPSVGKSLRGGHRIANLYFVVAKRLGDGMRIALADINGEAGLLRFVDETLESVQIFETDGHRIVRIHSQRNPDKLERIARSLAT
ncbi:MAG: RNA polymerase subunit sigma-24, partial [Gammaproteobacteria bacterium]|nr:RNA polymerase subunit sigma-24 [Gammaproteobacteria bacterium]